MAKQEATLLVKIKESGAATINKMKGLFGGFVITAGDLVNAFKRVAAVVSEFVGKAVDFQGVSNAFSNLAASQNQDADKMIAKMRELSGGMVSDLNLMKQANQAMLLGLPVDRFGEMLEIARSAARATGQSMDFMLQSIVTGLGRGSKLMLDNLGILINVEQAQKEYAASIGKTANQLTESEKKQAFINKALDVGTANARAAGASSGDLGSQWQRLKSQAENLAISFATKLLPSIEAIVYAGNFWIDVFSKMFPSEVNQSVDELTAKIDRLKIKMSELAAAGGGGPSGTRIDMVRAEIEELEALKEEAISREMALEEKKRQGVLLKEAQLAEERKALAETKALEKAEDKALELELEMAMIGANEEQKLALQIQFDEKKIAHEEDKQKRLEMMRAVYQKKELLAEQLHNKQKQTLDMAYSKARVNIFSSTANLISAVTGRESKIAFLAQQGAAIAQALVATHLAAAQALAVPPAPNVGLASLARTAGMINVAAIGATTIKGLADGGIVSSRNGGGVFQIGEGGRDEAVVPLPDDFDPDRGFGSGITVHFNGPVMGDESQAREFAKVLDRQFLELRRNNESVSFDTDVT